ncbi:hypothetical protein [Haladaptatus sp. CMAA 1911]|uniref:hypothetical protein n=1 Tax=unclassified Haladaptatus TaxID=2622732 RepID=UPI003754DB40
MQNKTSLEPETNYTKSPHQIPKSRHNGIQTLGRLLIGMAVLFVFTNPVSAQQTIGSDLCGTPLARTINFAAPLAVGITMIASSILAYVLHNAAAFPKDPQSVQSIKAWRNRAVYAAVTTPLFAFVLDLLIRSTGVGLAGCVDIVPFF